MDGTLSLGWWREQGSERVDIELPNEQSSEHGAAKRHEPSSEHGGATRHEM